MTAHDQGSERRGLVASRREAGCSIYEADARYSDGAAILYSNGDAGNLVRVYAMWWSLQSRQASSAQRRLISETDRWYQGLGACARSIKAAQLSRTMLCNKFVHGTRACSPSEDLVRGSFELM